MHTVTNPDETIAVRLDPDEPDGTFQVDHGDRTVIEPSPLGVATPTGRFPDAYAFAGSERETVEETVRTARGKRREHDHRATVATFSYEAEGDAGVDGPEDGAGVDLEVCAATDGIAYRYRVDGDGGFLLFEEESAFEFHHDAVAWLHGFDRAHEAVGRHQSLSEADGEFSPPGLVRIGDSWVLLAEAGVDGTYATARLATAAEDERIEYRHHETAVRLEFPATTPWRVAVIGDLAAVAESSLVPRLVDEAPPGGDERPVSPDADWVQPGRVAWSWWSAPASPADVETQRRYVDYAAERGWEYVLVDEGWSAEWVPELVEYADERGVDVVVWAHFTELNRAADREAKLDRWADWGVAGVKVDFMDHDDQGRMQFYDATIEATAERELLVNFHGSVVPTGISRRWPHVMTYEGVKGAEYLNWSGLPPEHNAVLPYTRNVVGPMDYTPVTFSASRYTSAGHELALAVVFESGLQHFADAVEAYADRPAAEWFLERVPAAWDETVHLQGHPGTEATIARRRDGDWFVGSVTAGPARRVAIDLEFLDGERAATLVREDDDGEALSREELTLRPGEELSVPVAEHGGFVLYAPENDE